MFSLHRINDRSKLLLRDAVLIIIGISLSIIGSTVLLVALIVLNAPHWFITLITPANFLFGLIITAIGEKYDGIYYTSNCNKSSLEKIKIKHKKLRDNLSELEVQFEAEKASVIKAKEDEELFYKNLKDMKIGD